MTDIAADPADFACPICGGSVLGPYRGRARARCASCGALERSRLLQLVLESLRLFTITGDVLHLAPEIGIARRLRELLGARYVACDIDPTIYENRGFAVKRLDVCRDLQHLPSNSIGCIVHVHVLEHVRCNAALVLSNMARVIRPGGYHVFGLPFVKGHYREDQDPTMSAQRRLEVFGHEDHVRLFGTDDFDVMFGPILGSGFQELNVRELIDERRLKSACVPSNALTGKSSHSIRVLEKLESRGR